MKKVFVLIDIEHDDYGGNTVIGAFETKPTLDDVKRAYETKYNEHYFLINENKLYVYYEGDFDLDESGNPIAIQDENCDHTQGLGDPSGVNYEIVETELFEIYPKNDFSVVVIVWEDDPETERIVQISHFDDIRNDDDEFFFYGMSEAEIDENIEKGIFNSDGWRIIRKIK